MNTETEDRINLKIKLGAIEEQIESLEEIDENDPDSNLHADIAILVNKRNNLEKYIKGIKDSPITSIEPLK